jgi:hypothetical protein
MKKEKRYVDISMWINEKDYKPYSNSPQELIESYEYIVYQICKEKETEYFEECVRIPKDALFRHIYEAYTQLPYRDWDEDEDIKAMVTGDLCLNEEIYRDFIKKN